MPALKELVELGTRRIGSDDESAYRSRPGGSNAYVTLMKQSMPKAR